LLVISPLIFLNLDLLLAPPALEQFLSRAIFDLKRSCRQSPSRLRLRTWLARPRRDQTLPRTA
jgi:hypothetical protein